MADPKVNNKSDAGYYEKSDGDLAQRDGGIAADSADTGFAVYEAETIGVSDAQDEVIIEDFADAVGYCYDDRVDVCERAQKLFSVEAYFSGQSRTFETCDAVTVELESPDAFGDIDEAIDLMTCSAEQSALDFAAGEAGSRLLTLKSLSTDSLLKSLAPFITYQDLASED